MATPRCIVLSKTFSNIAFTMSKACSTSSNSTKTVDAQEISHFNNYSANWWHAPISIPLHSMNRLRVPFVRDGLINTGVVNPDYINTAEPLKDLAVLDVGCGGGILSEPLARLGCNLIGLDASVELIEVAKRHAALDPSLTNLTYECSTIENHVINNAEKYDAVVSSEVIEHITEKKLFLEACIKCLKPGGSIFMTTLNKTNISWFVAIILAEYVLRAIPKGTHEYEKFIAPHQLQRLLEDYDCHTTVVHGMWYNYFTDTWNWTSNNSMSYALQAVKN